MDEGVGWGGMGWDGIEGMGWDRLSGVWVFSYLWRVAWRCRGEGGGIGRGEGGVIITGFVCYVSGLSHIVAAWALVPSQDMGQRDIDAQGLQTRKLQ